MAYRDANLGSFTTETLKRQIFCELVSCPHVTMLASGSTNRITFSLLVITGSVTSLTNHVTIVNAVKCI